MTRSVTASSTKHTRASLLIAALLLLPLYGCGGEGQSRSGETPPAEVPDSFDTFITSNTILDVLRREGNYARFVEVLRAVELDQALENEGPFTVFAPSDEAFAALPADTLERWMDPANSEWLEHLVLNHLIPGDISSATLKNQASLISMSGTRLPIESSNDTLRIGAALLVEDGYSASNGQVYPINQVLMPDRTVSQ